MFLASLMLLVAAPQDAGDAHARLAAELVSVLPPDEEMGTGPAELDEYDIARLESLVAENPGKDDAIRAILLDHAQCSADKSHEEAMDSLLESAKALSDADLRALIAFYTGPDYAKMEGAAEDSPEFKALIAKYPLMNFYEAMQKVMGDNAFDRVFENEQACDAATDAKLAQAGISE